MPQSLIDSHCHIHGEQAQEALNGGLQGLVQGGIDPEDWQRQLLFASQYPGRVHCSLGIHPWQVAAHVQDDSFLELYWKDLNRIFAAHRSSIVAIGETGLDHLPRQPKESWPVQEKWFQKHLEFAKRENLPVVLHIVRAHPHAIGILKNFASGSTLKGVVHAFHSDYANAKKYLALGLLLSIGPEILAPRSSLCELLKRLPVDSLVVESDDCHDHSPLVVNEIGRKLAELVDMDLESIQETLAANSRRLFSI